MSSTAVKARSEKKRGATFAVGDISLTNTNTIDGTKKSVKAADVTYSLVNTGRPPTPAVHYPAACLRRLVDDLLGLDARLPP